MSTRAEAYEKRERAVKLAQTYLRKSEAWLYCDPPLPPSSSYWDLLDTALGVAFEILRKLPDDYFETTPVENWLGLPSGLLPTVNLSDAPHERVEKIVKLLEERRTSAKRRRRIVLLEQVEGRSPEEAEAYLAKAAELRERA